jgi:predicted dehydrogenase
VTNRPVGVAVIGAGVISKQYLENLGTFPDVRVLGIGDLDTARAAAVAAEHDVPVSGTLDTVLAMPEVEVVVNLTIPAAHAAVAMASVEAGKHVYGEKPLALTGADGAKILSAAADRGLLVGNAPDTFLGAGIQSAIRAVDRGAIGQPVSAALITRSPGPERWHPNPAFLYQVGAGPLFDIGPYHLTALVSALGPIARVAGIGGRARPQRTIGSGPLAGTQFDVEVATHVVALLDFATGPSASATFSFDSTAPLVSLEINGTEGTLKLPDPNTFGGPLQVYAPGSAGWQELPVEGAVAGRGLGVLDLARAVRTGQQPRASGALGMHVLEAMSAILDSAEHAEFRALSSTVDRPAVLPEAWDPYEATLGG